MKQLYTLSIFFFFIFIHSVNYHHPENIFLQDDCLIFDVVDDDSDISTCDIHQVFSNAHFISTVSINKNLIIPYVLTCKFCTRAPPA